MSLWGNLDAANNAPKFAGTGGIRLGFEQACKKFNLKTK